MCVFIYKYGPPPRVHISLFDRLFFRFVFSRHCDENYDGDKKIYATSLCRWEGADHADRLKGDFDGDGDDDDSYLYSNMIYLQ